MERTSRCEDPDHIADVVGRRYAAGPGWFRAPLDLIPEGPLAWPPTGRRQPENR
jgi:hypothetical protein